MSSPADKAVARKIGVGGAWLGCLILLLVNVYGATGTASWYSIESCIKESGQYTMANGKELNDELLTCASWDYAFGTKLHITNIRNGKSCVVRVSDRGPARRLYRMGRIIDLSKRAFSELALLEQGIIEVNVKVIKGR